MIEITKVATQDQVKVTSALAHEIWNEHFVPFIGPDQVDYMLDLFQSPGAIREQMKKGYEYFLVTDGGKRAGYFAIVPCWKDGSAQLSKIYVRRARRRRGIGSEMEAFVEEWCLKKGLDRLWLTVNRHNAGPVAFYENLGFVKAGCLVQEIGGGFVMDDYKMVKELGGRREKDGQGHKRRQGRSGHKGLHKGGTERAAR
jgi:diamine N-acetyltransferase